MKLPLDTHLLLWAAFQPASLICIDLSCERGTMSFNVLKRSLKRFQIFGRRKLIPSHFTGSSKLPVSNISAKSRDRNSPILSSFRGSELISCQVTKDLLVGKILFLHTSLSKQRKKFCTQDLLVERTQAGLARAKSEGKTLGRPSKTPPEERADIVAKYAAGESVSALATMFEVSRASILSTLKSAGNYRI